MDSSINARSLDVLVLYNEPSLPADHPDWAAEAGVLESVEAVEAALVQYGHRVRRHGVGPRVEDVLDHLAGVAPADVVFNLFEGFSGVGRGEAEVSGLVELLGFPMTGSGAESLALVRDKARTKWLLAGAGLPTAEFRLIRADEPVPVDSCRDLLAAGPLIVKPAHEDASQGIGPESIVHDASALERQVATIRERYGAVLVERFIAGREFNAAVIDLGQPELLPLAEIEFSGPGEPGMQIVTYDAKWIADGEADRATPARCPANVDEATAVRIHEVALAAFRLTGCRDYARVDMRTDSQGRVYILEVNGNPDIGPSAGLARAIRTAGYDYAELVNRMVRHVHATRGSSVERTAHSSILR